MNSPSKRQRVTNTVWQVEANRRVAVWRQQLPETRTLVHSHFLLEAAKNRGITLEDLGSTNYTDLGGIRAYKDTLKEVQTKMQQWDETLQTVETVVYAAAVVECAEKSGIIIRSVAEDLLSLYVAKQRKMADAGVQVQVDCPFCTSFVDDIEEVSGYSTVCDVTCTA